MVSVVEHDSLTHVDRAAWNSLIPHGYCSVRWEYLYAAQQHCGEAFSSFRYYLFKEGDAVTGAAIAYSVAISFANMLPPSMRRAVEWLGRAQRFTVTMCGSIASDALPGIFLARQSSRPDILSLLDDRLKAFARETRSMGVIYKEFSRPHGDVMDYLVARGYVRTPSLPSYSIPVRWEDIDGYCAALKCDYRRSLLKTRRKMDAPALSCVLISEPSQVPGELYRLYRYVHDKAQYRIETVQPGFFAELLRQHGGKAVLLAFVLGGKPIGFVVLVEDEASLQGIYLGYDPEYNERYDLYFNLVYQSLSLAMQKKKEKFILGQTADAFKMRLGCTPEDTWFLFSFDNPALHALLKRLMPVVFSYPSQPPRNVFKAGRS